MENMIIEINRYLNDVKKNLEHIIYQSAIQVTQPFFIIYLFLG